MARTAFVTGGTGFIGIVLVDRLLAEGWSVTALHRASSDLTYLGRRDVTLAEGDVTDDVSVRRAMPEGADAVFHLAGDLNLWSRNNARQDRVNVGGTRTVARAALDKGAKRFVHTSTISVYGMQTGRIDESAPKAGRESWINYQRTKYLAEVEVLEAVEAGLDAVIMNPAAVVGAYDTTGWARLIRMAHAGTLPGVPPGALSFAHVGAVADAHRAAVDKGETGGNYLLGGVDATFAEAVATIGEIVGRPVPTRTTPAWLLKLVGRVGAIRGALTGREPRITPETAAMVSRRLFADCSKAERELGYAAVPLRDMLRESHDWLEAEGLLEG